MNETIRRIYELQVKLAADSLNALKQLQQSAASVDKTMKDATGTSERWAKGLAAGFTVGGVIASIKSVIDAIDDLGRKSAELSLPVDEFLALSFAAGQAGVKTGDMERSMKELERTMSEFGSKTKKSTRILEALGLDPTGKSPVDFLIELAGALQKIADPALRARAQLELLGSLKLAPLLERGAAGIRELTEAAKDWVGTAENAVEQQGYFEAALKRMQATTDTLRRAFVEGLLPELTRVVESFSGMPTAAESFKEFGRFVGDVLKNIVIYARGAVLGIELVAKAAGAAAASAQAILKLDFREALLIWGAFGEDVAASAQSMADFKQSLDDSGPIVEKHTAAVQRNVKAEKDLANALADTTRKKKESNAASEAAARALEAERRIFAEAWEFYNKFVEKEEKAREERQRSLDALLAGTPIRKTEEFLRKIDELNTAFFEGTISLDLYNQGIEALTGATKKVQPELSDLEQILKAIADKVDGYSQRISGLFIDWATGAADAKLSFTDFVVSTLRQLAQMTVQMLVVDKAVKLFTTQIAGWGTGGGYSAQLDALGDAFERGRVIPLARGAVVTRPTLFAMAGGMGLMGEAGPEAVMPLKRGADGKLGVSGGSTVNVTVINNASSAHARSEESQQPDGTKDIRVIIEDIVDRGLSNGRFDTSMRQIYGASRRGRM